MSIYDFLNRYKTTGSEFTHTSLMKPRMKLNVKDEDLSTFQDRYIEEFKKGTPMGIVEKHCDVSPVLIDLDFKLNTDDQDGENYFTHDNALQFMDTMLRILNRLVYLPTDLTYYVLTKPTRVVKKSNQKKYGIHVIIPDVITEPFYQHETRRIFIEENPDFFKSFPFLNAIEDIYDEAVIEKNAWLMYGSKKEDDPLPWKVYSTVEVDTSMNFNRKTMISRDDNDASKESNYIKRFSIRDVNINGEREVAKVREFGLKALEDRKNPKLRIRTMNPEVDAKKAKKTKTRKEKRQENYDNLDGLSSVSQLHAYRQYPKDDDNCSVFSTTSLSESNYRSNSIVDYEERRMMQSFVRECVESLDDSRAGNYDDWLNVCFCLQNIVGDHYKTFIDFSKRWSKFDQAACDDKWSKKRENYDKVFAELNIGSLLGWVRDDNDQEDFDIITLKKKKIDDMLQAYDKPCSIAKVIKLKYNGLYLHGKKQWYKFVKEDHRWELMNTHFPLREKITNEVHDEYSDFVLKVSLDIKMWKRTLEKYEQMEKDEIQLRENKEKEEKEDGNEKKDDGPTTVVVSKYQNMKDKCQRHILESENRLQLYQRTVNRLYESTFKNQIMNELEEQFDDQHGLIKKFDDNKALLGFKNGVYDLDKLEFRNGCPADLITFSTGYEYDANEDPVIQKEIIDFMRSIMKDEEHMDYMFKILAYGLHGNKYLEDFFFFTGSGRNGKGTLMTLMNKTFGDYYYEPSIETFTTAKYTADNASPELKKFRGKRMIVSSEPDDTDPRLKFRANQLKRFRGNDIITTRGLYEDVTSFYPQFSMYFQMNAIPEISKADSAIADTLKIVDFPYKFTKNPTMPHEKMGDPSIKNKLTTDVKYAQQMMLILLKTYKEHCHGYKHIVAPQNVTRLSREYVEENNPILSWFTNTIEIVSDESKTLSATDLWFMFKSDSGLNVSAVLFGREMFQIIGKKSKVVNRVRSYCGVILRPSEEGEDNDRLTFREELE